MKKSKKSNKNKRKMEDLHIFKVILTDFVKNPEDLFECKQAYILSQLDKVFKLAEKGMEIDARNR